MPNASRLNDKIKQRDFKLNALLALTQAINANHTEDELLIQFKSMVETHLGIQRLALYILRDGWQCVLHYGDSEQFPFEIPQTDFFKKNKGLAFSEGTNQDVFDVVIPVVHNNEPMAVLLAGDTENDTLGISPAVKHMNFLQTLTSVLAVALDNKRLVQDMLQQERLKKELELAAEIQMMLLPSSFPKNKNWDVQGIYRAHQQVGGDYYDVFPISDHEWVFCMGDVSGKGMPAAFLMSNFQAYVRNAFEGNLPNLVHLANRLNERVWNAVQGEKFITFFLAVYNAKNKHLHYVNCGHNPPVFKRDGRFAQWKATSVGLGMFPDLPFISSVEVQLDSGDGLVCYTDGLVEIDNAQGVAFEIDGIINHFQGKTSKDVISNIEAGVNEFRGEESFNDDVAIMAMIWH
jgi:phosphoserine phosphatase RsbU/P